MFPCKSTMGLKASARGPAFLLCAAFTVLLLAGAFMDLSSALSAGLLTSSKSLSYYRLSNLGHLVLEGRGDSRLRTSIEAGELSEEDFNVEGQSAGNDLQSGLEGRELSEEDLNHTESKVRGETEPSNDKGEFLKEGKVLAAGFNTRSSDLQQRTEQNEERDTAAESVEASDLMLPPNSTASAESSTASREGMKTDNESSTIEQNMLRGTEKVVVLSATGRASASETADASVPGITAAPFVLVDGKKSESASSYEAETKASSKQPIQALQPPDPDEHFEAFLNAKALADDSNADSNSRPKVAFLFLTRGPLFHELLWQRFFQENEDRFSIYVHASSKGFIYNETTSKAPVFFNRQIKSIKVTWGGLNMVRAERRLLAYALMDRSNERFVLVSESCIPLRTFNFTYDYLFALDKSFISSFHTTWRYKNSLAPLIPKHQWRKGAQWFTLTRKDARLVVEDVDFLERIKVAETSIADEHYLQTMLPMKDPKGLVPRPLTYAAWPVAKASHPLTFTKKTLSLTVIRQIQNMTRPVEEDSSYGKKKHVFDECSETGTLRPCYLFARKFTRDTASRVLGIADDMWNGNS